MLSPLYGAEGHVDKSPDTETTSEAIEQYLEKSAVSAALAPFYEHWLYDVIPEHRQKIDWYHGPHWASWALFGNDDDGLFGERVRKDETILNNLPDATVYSAGSWWLRNPLHNFTFYVIGRAHNPDLSSFTLFGLGDKRGLELMKYKKEGSTVFAGKRNGIWIGFHGWLPFVSIKLFDSKLIETYAGWREKGNFGLKFIPFRNVFEKDEPSLKDEG